MRHELKYILTPVQYRVLKDRIKWVLDKDPHAGENGEYAIRSIYFDTRDYNALSEKTDGVDRRKKYRIRFYNQNAERCTLECKEKKGTRINKTSEKLTGEEVNILLDTKEVLVEGRLSSEMAILLKQNGFVPVVTVDYVREAYIYPVSNVRITFDKQLSGLPVEGALEAPLGFPNIMGENVILEVKYDEVLPAHISDLIGSVRPVQTAASKYVMCLEHEFIRQGRMSG